MFLLLKAIKMETEICGIKLIIRREDLQKKRM